MDHAESNSANRNSIGATVTELGVGVHTPPTPTLNKTYLNTHIDILSI